MDCCLSSFHKQADIPAYWCCCLKHILQIILHEIHFGMLSASHSHKKIVIVVPRHEWNKDLIKKPQGITKKLVENPHTIVAISHAVIWHLWILVFLKMRSFRLSTNPKSENLIPFLSCIKFGSSSCHFLSLP